jgi:hypothetical protein
MREAGTPQLKESGMWFTCTERRSWSIPDESRDLVFALLEQHQPDALKKTVAPATLTKMANDPAADWHTDLRSALVAKVSQGLSVSKSKPKAEG